LLAVESSGALLVERVAPSPQEIPVGDKSLVGAHRHAVDHRQWGAAATQASGRVRLFYARPPPYRLDGRVRRLSYHIGALAGDGRDRRHRYRLLYPYLCDRA